MPRPGQEGVTTLGYGLDQQGVLTIDKDARWIGLAIITAAGLTLMITKWLRTHLRRGEPA